MKKTWLFSIRSKILFVLSSVLVSAVGLYLYLASQLFFEDKKLLVYELNQTSVSSLGQEVEIYFKQIVDKLIIVASLDARDPATLKAILPQLVPEEEGYLRIATLDLTRAQKTLGVWTRALELDGKGASDLDQLRRDFPIPLERVTQSGVWIKNVTLQGEEAAVGIVTVAARVTDQEVIYADLKLDRMISAFSRKGLAHSYLVDSDGFALADTEAKRIKGGFDLKTDPLVTAASASKVRSELKSFDEGGTAFLGSYFKLNLGHLLVGSKTQAGEAFAAAQVLIRKSLLYASLVVTVAFLIALFLAHSITVPIRRMVEATHQIAQGDFNIELPNQTGDELAVLSRSFNSMTGDLKTSREQLRVAQAQLVHSERLSAIGQVARSIGHEFGNILFVITGNANFAMKAQTLEKTQDRVRLISQATERASIIVRNLNSFAKNESTRKWVNPSQIIRDTLSLLDHETKVNNVKVDAQCGPCPEVWVGASEIEQVLLNLMINAMHAMPKGGDIQIGCKDVDGQIHFWVKDSGVGIPPEILPKIFDYAFTTKGDKGSGLGLAISKQIIESHGGVIEVDSTLGVGTTFTLTIPKEMVA